MSDIGMCIILVNYIVLIMLGLLGTHRYAWLLKNQASTVKQFLLRRK